MHRPFALPGTQPRYAPDRAVRHPAHPHRPRHRRRAAPHRRHLHADPDAHRRPTRSWVELDAVELDIATVSRRRRAAGATATTASCCASTSAATLATGEPSTSRSTYSGSPRRGLYFIGPDDGYPDKPLQVWTPGPGRGLALLVPLLRRAPREGDQRGHRHACRRASSRCPTAALVDDPRPTASERTPATGSSTCRTRAYLMTLAAGELRRDRSDRGATSPVRLLRARRAARPTAERTLRPHAARCSSCSRERFGVPYPYDKYAQVFVADFIFGGMENTTATTLTDAVLLDERAALDFDIDALVAHELAHQWFGDLVTCRDWGEGWLNEGFATYAEYIWREHHEGRDAADLELDEWAEQYFGEDAARYRRRSRPTSTTSRSTSSITTCTRRAAAVLHMLRRRAGRRRLLALASATTCASTGPASVETRDLARAVEEATGRVLDWFFDQWVLDGAGHPELEVAYAWDARRASWPRSRSSRRRRSRATRRCSGCPTAVRFRVGGERPRRRRRDHTSSSRPFYFPLDAEPTPGDLRPGQARAGRGQDRQARAAVGGRARGRQRWPSTASTPPARWRKRGGAQAERGAASGPCARDRVLGGARPRPAAALGEAAHRRRRATR